MNYKELSGPELIETCGVDAMKWAEAFIQIVDIDNIDTGIMCSWFANTIEHAKDWCKEQLKNDNY